MLFQVTDDEAWNLCQNSGRGNGLEAWRKLTRRYDPATGVRRRNLLRSVLRCGRCKLEGLNGALEEWEARISRYGRSSTPARDLDEDIEVAALESFVPRELVQHLLLNAGRLGTYEHVRTEVVFYIEAKTR